MSDKLDPCPFCSGDPILDEHCDENSLLRDQEGSPVYFTIACPGCGIDMMAATKDEVVKKWNTRAEIGQARPTGIVPLAKEHTGMRISAEGILLRVRGNLKFGALEMARHLRETARRFYAGDLSVVDEFLQLYCLDEARPKKGT